jgi:hypothetical protein
MEVESIVLQYRRSIAKNFTFSKTYPFFSDFHFRKIRLKKAFAAGVYLSEAQKCVTVYIFTQGRVGKGES